MLFLSLLTSRHSTSADTFFFTRIFDVNRNDAQELIIFQYHRDRLGIYWRGRGKYCQVPPELVHHKSAVKGDRGLVKQQSIDIKETTGKLIPVGSGMITAKTKIKLN